MEDDKQQENSDLSRVPKQLQPHVYKKGQSGNPHGRPIGAVSMKTYVRNKLLAMTPEEREEFLEGIDKKVLWEMAEGKAKQDVEVDHTQRVVIQFDGAFDNEAPSETEGDSTDTGEV